MGPAAGGVRCVARPVVVLVVLASSAAFAEEAPAALGTVRLRYSRARGAEACPDERTLTDGVIARLGYDPFQADASRALDVSIVVEGGQLRASLLLTRDGAEPSRHQLSSSALDCSVLHPALSLAIALAIDPARAVELDAGPALPAPAPPRAFPKPLPVAPSLVLQTPRTPAEVGPARRAVRGIVYGGGYAAVAAGPTTTGGLEVGGAAVFRHFSIGAELRGDMPILAVSDELEVGRLIIETVPCLRAFAFGFCALAATGLTIARGHGFAVSKQVLAPYVAVGARLMAEVPMGRRLALGLHADVLGLVTRLVLHVDADVVYRDAPASGNFGLDFIGRFGDGT